MSEARWAITVDNLRRMSAADKQERQQRVFLLRAARKGNRQARRELRRIYKLTLPLVEARYGQL